MTEIEEYTFNYCAHLTSVTIPDSVTYIADKNAFGYCKKVVITYKGQTFTFADRNALVEFINSQK